MILQKLFFLTIIGLKLFWWFCKSYSF